MRSRLQPWIPALVWGAVIFTFSTASFSSAHTSSLLLPALHWLLPFASHGHLLAIHHAIRKCAHLSEYFVFGWLLLSAVRSPERGWTLRWAILALLIAAAYSATDEWHQSFVPGRDPSAWDSLLDTTGASAALLTTWFVVRHQRATGASGSPRIS